MDLISEHYVWDHWGRVCAAHEHLRIAPDLMIALGDFCLTCRVQLLFRYIAELQDEAGLCNRKVTAIPADPNFFVRVQTFPLTEMNEALL